MTNRRPYLCPDGSEPCGRYGFCGYCPHDKKAKNRPSSANATEADALMRELAEALDYLESRHVVEADVEYGAACEKAQTALKNYQEYARADAVDEPFAFYNGTEVE